MTMVITVRLRGDMVVFFDASAKSEIAVAAGQLFVWDYGRRETTDPNSNGLVAVYVPGEWLSVSCVPKTE